MHWNLFYLLKKSFLFHWVLHLIRIFKPYPIFLLLKLFFYFIFKNNFTFEPINSSVYHDTIQARQLKDSKKETWIAQRKCEIPCVTKTQRTVLIKIFCIRGKCIIHFKNSPPTLFSEACLKVPFLSIEDTLVSFSQHVLF